jgi:vacuolar-type H+-ATPase subunit H
MKLRLLAVSLILFTGVSAAQPSNNSSIDASPGLVKADSPIYGLDVAFDNMLQTAGLKSAGEVAVERASEVAVAERRNHSEAAEKALNRFNSAVREANNRNRKKLQQAEQVLKQVRQRVPEEARQGIDTALENVGDAKGRVPDELTAPGGGVLPDVEMPEGSDGDIESPGSGDAPVG